MSPATKNISGLTMLAKPAAYVTFRNHFLLNLTFDLWAGLTDREAAEAWREMAVRLSGDAAMRRLLVNRLFVDMLLDSARRIPVLFDLVDDTFGSGNLSGALSRALAFKGRWTAVPTVVVGAEAYVRYWILGCLPENPPWAPVPDWTRALLDDEALSAIFIARKAALKAVGKISNGTILAFPMVADTKFSGGSLGLPLAMGFHALLEERNLPENLLATGGITEEGAVTAVDALDRKVECARNRPFDLFLYPETHAPLSNTGATTALMVRDLEEAIVLSEIHDPETCRRFLACLETLDSGGHLAETLKKESLRCLGALAGKKGKRAVIKRTIASEDGFSPFVSALEDILSEVPLDWRRGEFVLQLADPAIQEQARKKQPAAFLRLCNAGIDFCNHRGRITEALEWVERGRTVLEKARQADLASCTGWVTRRFVIEHNRYRFDPNPPDDVAAVLKDMETLYQVNRDMGCIVDAKLGELYGTIAQNYGFCGPDYLDQAEAYCEKAWTAFGGGASCTPIGDALRQQVHRMYARLDAGQYESARNALWEYLGWTDWTDLTKQPVDAMNRFHHAALARFFADTGPSASASLYMDLVGENPVAASLHPNQLWLYSLGRIRLAMDRREDAIACFRKSLAICLDDAMGPTVHVMALLPLSGLFSLNVYDDSGRMENKIRKAARQLDPDGFPLLRTDLFEDMLERIWKDPGKLFPFSYR